MSTKSIESILSTGRKEKLNRKNLKVLSLIKPMLRMRLMETRRFLKEKPILRLILLFPDYLPKINRQKGKFLTLKTKDLVSSYYRKEKRGLIEKENQKLRKVNRVLRRLKQKN